MFLGFPSESYVSLRLHVIATRENVIETTYASHVKALKKYFEHSDTTLFQIEIVGYSITASALFSVRISAYRSV